MVELDTLISELKEKRGDDFEKSVSAAFNFLGFDCEWTGENEASPDVTVKAPMAEKPFVVIIECCAVEEQNQVSHGKVSQLRDYYPTFQVEHGREGWSLVYPVLVGRPAFSDPCRRYADVGNASISSHTKIRLIPIHVLCDVISNYDTFQFSQDELKPIFGFDESIHSVELSTLDLNKIYAASRRRIKLYALIFAGLVNDPIRKDYNPKFKWVSVDELYGTIKTYSSIAYGIRFKREELVQAVTDLSSPIVKAVEMGFRDGRYYVKRAVLANIKFAQCLGRLTVPFVNETLNIYTKLSQA